MTRREIIQTLLLAILPFILGLVLSPIGELSGLEVGGALECAIAIGYIIATLMTFFIRKNPKKLFLWTILGMSGILIYQIGVFRSFAQGYVILRILPLLILSGGILMLSGFGRASIGFLGVTWIVLNIPSVVIAILSYYLAPADALAYGLLNIFVPVSCLSAVREMGQHRDGERVVEEVLSIAAAVIVLIPLVLIPLEMYMRVDGGVNSIQFGRSYAVIGVMILSWPFVLQTTSRLAVWTQVFYYTLMLASLLTTYSRGALVFGVGILTMSPLIVKRRRLAILVGLPSAGLLITGVSILVFPDYTKESLWFWGLRLNLVSNTGVGGGDVVGELVHNSRFELWNIGFQLFMERPTFGHGLGMTPFLLGEATAYEANFGGMHSFLITVLVERGIIGLLLVGLVIGRIFWLLAFRQELRGVRMLVGFCVSIFILFASSTGVELFLNSSRSMNVHLTNYLFLIIGYLELKGKFSGRQVE